jgi:hypothetical protein
MVLSRTTAWTALSLTFPLDHFFFFAAFPLEVAGLAALLGGYKQNLSDLARMSSKVKNCNPSLSPPRDRRQSHQMQLGGRPEGLGGNKEAEYSPCRWGGEVVCERWAGQLVLCFRW